MDVLTGLSEIWTQNVVDAPTDRAATIAAILKGDSRIAFDTALEDERVNIDPEAINNDPVEMTTEHIEKALRAVTDIVFPFRALEVQKQWMTRYMKKPFDLSTKKMNAALSRINNYLPQFPGGTAASKYSESELVGLLEFSLPTSWRNAMDLKGFVPSNSDRKELIEQCARIERNETPIQHEKDDDNDNNKNNKKVKFAKTQNDHQKNGGKTSPTKVRFDCRKCGQNNGTHDTVDCFILKRLAREAEQAARGNGSGKAQAKPYSKRTFRKEVNAMVRRAGKHDGLDVMSSAIQREQGKSAKRDKKQAAAKAAKKAKKNKEESEDSGTSSDDPSVNNLELPIPRKVTRHKTPKVPKPKSIFDGLQDLDSSNEDDMVIEASAEEKAFLQSIRKEEADQTEKNSAN
jgi:hypothetical protein